MKRPKMTDLAEAAGVSVATVDRVLNSRHPVRDGTAQRVLEAAQRIGFHAAPLLKRKLRADVPAKTFGFLLQKRDAFYQQFAADLTAATAALHQVKGKCLIEFEPDLSSNVMAQRLRDMGRKADAIGVVAVDHPHITEAIAHLRERGVPVFGLLTDLTAPARTGFVGRDNRKEGRTAAWIITRTARKAGKIGVILGSHRYLCQETAESSFRAYCRENAPEFRPLEPLVNLDEPRITYAAVQDMIGRNPDLVGLYICGGGTDGALDAVCDEARHDLTIVCNELTPKNRAALIDGILTAVISTPTAQLSKLATEAMADILTTGNAHHAPAQIITPFDLFVATNI